MNVEKIKKWTPLAGLLLAASVLSESSTVWDTFAGLWVSIVPPNGQLYWVGNIHVNGDDNQAFQSYLDAHEDQLVFFDAMLNTSTAGVLKYEHFWENCGTGAGFNFEMPIDGRATYSDDGKFTPISFCGSSTFRFVGKQPSRSPSTGPLGIWVIKVRGMFLVEKSYSGLTPHYTLTEQIISTDRLGELLEKTSDLRKEVPDPI